MSMEWQATVWRPVGELYSDDPWVPYIVRMGSPFYEGERFAVRNDLKRCLTVDGEWEHEPMPSSRDDTFYEWCRFKSFEAARDAAEGAMPV